MDDTNRDMLLRKFRLPVDDTHPRKDFIISIDDESVNVTEEEAVLLDNYRLYVLQFYSDAYIKVILAREFPADGGHNTTVFRKSTEDGVTFWQFRRATWQYGPFFVPPHPQWGAYPKAGGLRETLDGMEGQERYGDSKLYRKWTEWKAKYPELYGNP